MLVRSTLIQNRYLYRFHVLDTPLLMCLLYTAPIRIISEPCVVCNTLEQRSLPSSLENSGLDAHSLVVFWGYLILFWPRNCLYNVPL